MESLYADLLSRGQNSFHLRYWLSNRISLDRCNRHGKDAGRDPSQSNREGAGLRSSRVMRWVFRGLRRALNQTGGGRGPFRISGKRQLNTDGPHSF